MTSWRKGEISRRDYIREKIMKRVKIDPETECYEWTGPTSGTRYKCDEAPKKGRGHGYPRMDLDGITVAVHIAAWTNEHGLIPPKKQLDHLCKNRKCVRWDRDSKGRLHIELVTHLQNQQRRAKAAREAKEAKKCKTSSTRSTKTKSKCSNKPRSRKRTTAVSPTIVRADVLKLLSSASTASQSSPLQ